MTPKIYAFCYTFEGWQRDVFGVALAEDGAGLAEHLSSNEVWSKYDMTATPGKLEAYAKHYPDGYDLVWLGFEPPLDEHPELAAALELNRQGGRGGARMTDEQLNEIESLAAAATPGPWRQDRWSVWADQYGPTVSRARAMNLADAAFIAASRSAVPALIAEVRGLQKKIAEFQYWRNFWRNHAETHERMWRETEELRQAERQEAIAAHAVATARAEAAEADAGNVRAWADAVPVDALRRYMRYSQVPDGHHRYSTAAQQADESAIGAWLSQQSEVQP